MKVATFAPHLAGRMLPALFSNMPDFKRPRFLGDPCPLFPHHPSWEWMHSTGCSFFVTSRRNVEYWRHAEVPTVAQVVAAARRGPIAVEPSQAQLSAEVAA